MSFRAALKLDQSELLDLLLGGGDILLAAEGHHRDLARAPVPDPTFPGRA
jgi:hypothetical protein